MQLGQRPRRDGREGVDLRLEGEQRGEELAARCLVSLVRGLDDHDLAPAENLRDVRDRRELEHAPDGGDLRRQVAGPLGPGAEHLARALHRPDEPAGVRLRNGVEGDLDLGDDAEAAAAAPERPEQVRVRLRVGADDLALGGDDLGREDARGGEPVRAREPANAAAERVADDADVLGRAMERGQAVLDRGVDHVDPDRAGGDPRNPGLGVDLDAGHPGHVHEQRAVEQVVTRAVTRALDGDAEPDGPRVVDGRDDVVDGLGKGDRRGPLVDSEVPGASRLVPAGIPGEGEDRG